jgi:8-oxo-dGTP pyrophosphatase MutT (NUDIX family)
MTAKCAHWGTHGAAGLLLVNAGNVLLQLRSAGVQQPGTWSIPGGARLKDETAQEAALREAAEETGLDPNAVKAVATYSDLCECGWSYTTLIANLIGTVELHGNWESERLELVPLKDVDALELHPGFKAAWPALRDMLKADDTRPNISQVAEQLWTGGDRGRTTPATWLAQLQHAGITHIIDARVEGQPDQAYTQTHAPHIGYLHNPQPDLGQTMPDQWFDVGVDFALHALADPDARVLAHCQLGINRGPSMAYAVLLAQGVTPDQARSRIVRARPIARSRYADQASRWWTNLTALPDQAFYHGGPRGLATGDMLLPPVITGATTLADRMMSGRVHDHETVLRDIHRNENHNLIFVTTDINIAAGAAHWCQGGAVYLVEPLGNLMVRTCYWSGVQETICESARILSVIGNSGSKALLDAQTVARSSRARLEATR